MFEAFELGLLQRLQEATPTAVRVFRLDQQGARSVPDAVALRKAARASFMGNFVEWFDYAAYGYLATIIAATFFPQTDKTSGLLATFAVFALSFLVRPLGGVVWGHFGDRHGRRNAGSRSSAPAATPTQKSVLIQVRPLNFCTLLLFFTMTSWMARSRVVAPL